MYTLHVERTGNAACRDLDVFAPWGKEGAMVPVFRMYGYIHEELQRRWIGFWIDNHSATHVRVLVRSDGGDLRPAMGMMNMVMAVKANTQVVFETVGVGNVCSAAVLLLGMGSRGHRYLLPQASVMVHQPTVTPKEVTDGYTYAALCAKGAETVELGVFNDAWTGWLDYTNRLAMNSRLKPRQWQNMTADGKDHWLDGEECLAVGLVDHVGLPPDVQAEGPY